MTIADDDARIRERFILTPAQRRRRRIVADVGMTLFAMVLAGFAGWAVAMGLR